MALFDAFPYMFFIVFITVFIIVVLTAIINFYRILRRPAQSLSEESAPVVKEREIIREVVKIRCPYCNNLRRKIRQMSPLRRQKKLNPPANI